MPGTSAPPRVRMPEGFWDAGTQDGRIVDLSVSGCFIESDGLPKVGQSVTVSIAITGGQINLPAEASAPATARVCRALR